MLPIELVPVFSRQLLPRPREVLLNLFHGGISLATCRLIPARFFDGWIVLQHRRANRNCGAEHSSNWDFLCNLNRPFLGAFEFR